MLKHLQNGELSEKKRQCGDWVRKLTSAPDTMITRALHDKAVGATLQAVTGHYLMLHDDATAHRMIQDAIDPLQARNPQKVQITSHHMGDVQEILQLQSLSREALQEIHTVMAPKVGGRGGR